MCFVNNAEFCSKIHYKNHLKLLLIVPFSIGTMAVIFLASLFSIIALATCGDHTVTEETWFDIEIKDYYGEGEDYRGRFVIAVFGETAPMTVTNFQHLVKGYKRTGVSADLLMSDAT